MLRKTLSAGLLLLLLAACGVAATESPGGAAQPAAQGGGPSAGGQPSPGGELSLDTLTAVAPKDVIGEIAYFGGLGGGGMECTDEAGKEYRKPAVIGGSFSSEVMYLIDLRVCGLKIGEDVQIQVELPDKTSRRFSAQSSGVGDQKYGEVDFEFTPDYHDPKGKYSFVFSGKGWSVDYSSTVTDPGSARLYYVFQEQLIFYKFRPNENVRLFVYSGDREAQPGRFLGWKQYRVDGNGELVLQVGQDAIFIAVGESSGQAIQVSRGETFGLAAFYGGKFDIYCPGAPDPLGIIPQKYAEVIVDTLPYYGRAGNRLGDLARGQVLEIASNATCKEASWWWRASRAGDWGNEFLVQEGTRSQAYLRPLAALPDTPTPGPADVPACPGTQPTRLRVGMNAGVTTSGKAPQLALRQSPRVNAGKVHVIAAGRKMVILEGPVCADGSYWWRIRSEQGFEGWAREGDNEDYWIDPLP